MAGFLARLFGRREVSPQRQVQEALVDLPDNWVDPRSAYYDNGERWTSIGDEESVYGQKLFETEQQLTDARNESRRLAIVNEFAINGHENRISYIVGVGHKYTVKAKPKREVDETAIAVVQDWLNEWHESICWGQWQQESVRRVDRDGEAFIRIFKGEEGRTEFRFIEPGQVARPQDKQNLATDKHSWGIEIDPDDACQVVAYWVDGERVKAEEIQHRKSNVDRNVKRGVPLFFPVRKNLRRAERLLRNMSTTVEVQSAIAALRTKKNATKAAIENMVAARADVSRVDPITARTQYAERYGPGSIITTRSEDDFRFPIGGLNAANAVGVLQAELRAIASRLVMPEFMLTSDASNANYASTMVAEGPAVKMFARLQSTQSEADLELIWEALHHASESGAVPRDILNQITIDVEPPTLVVRDRNKEIEGDIALTNAGVMSKKTLAARNGLDYETEVASGAKEAMQSLPGLPQPVSKPTAEALREERRRKFNALWEGHP